MNNRASSLRAHVFAEIDVWLIIITTAYWIFFILDVPARIILAVIAGFTACMHPKVEENIPWQDIILSPLHILIVTAICLIYLTYKRRRLVM